MGLFQKIFGDRKPAQTLTRSPDYKALTAYQPNFTAYNGKLYESDLVRAAINARATHISKLKIEFYGRGSEAVQKRLRKPNAFQTWSQFLARTSTILDANNSVIILPRMDKYGRVVELYPVLPDRARIVEVNGEPWVACEFASGQYAQVPVYQAAIMTKHQYKNDFFGETNGALTPTLKLIDIQQQGITEGIKSAATYRFMAQMNNFADPDDVVKLRTEFDEKNFNGKGGGLLLFPNDFVNISQIDSKPFVIDAEQMEAIRQSVYNYFGVNEDVLQNKVVGDSWNAFYEGCVEAFAVQLSETLTELFLLTGNLTGDAGVMATSNRLQYMSNSDKLNVSAQLADRGIMSRNEIREIWNLPPIDGGDDFVIRGEYYNANDKVTEVTEDADS